MKKEEVGNCVTCENHSCLMKKNYAANQYETAIANRMVIECKKSQSFIIEGAPIHGMYFVYSGKAKITKSGYNGKEQILRLTGDGDIIGIRGYSNRKVYPIAATALEPTTLCYFPNKFFTNELQVNSALTYDLMVFYAEELDKTEERVKKFAQMTVREKVVDSLLSIYDRFGQNSEGLNLVLSRTDIANLAGTNSEQVIRVLMTLKNEKVINCEGKNILLTKIDALRKEIQEYHY
ncbi:MAG: Crp/Fnr family transcriptional regulator [Bacteroidetes bacterium]|nr:Crp/Fnr family transcriptional regulator [Bacteroidota bacterium]